MNWLNFLVTLGILGVVSGLLIIGVGVILFRGFGFNKSWLSIPSFIRKLISYQIIGLGSLVIILIALSLPSQSLLQMEEITIDAFMDLHKNNIPPKQENDPAFVLLDIDNQTQISWGELLYTPRNRLRNLIDAAVQAQARVIIVDINVSGYNTPHDQELSGYLKEYITNCSKDSKENQSACPPIILVRGFKADSSPAIPQTGFLDEVVTTQSAPYVQWGSAESYSFESKEIARRWFLWQPTCTKDQPGVLPSIELLVTSMIRECREEVQNVLSQFKPKNCNNGNGFAALPTSKINFCGLEMSTNIYSAQQRIMYRIPWYDDTNKPKPYIVLDNNNVPILTVFSAESYAKSPLEEATKANLKTLTNSIVVIGSSSKGMDKIDRFWTPIHEQMPGALVIINGIYALSQGLIIKPVSYWIWFLIVAVFIVIVTAFSYFHGRWRFLGWGGIIIIIVVLFFYSIELFEFGTWLNLAIPLTIIEFYRRFYQMEWLEKIANWLFGIQVELKNNTHTRS
jgi:CHASE2 domain-containing sensor protein